MNLTKDLSLDSAPTYLVASADLPAVYASAMAPPIVFDAVYFEGGFACRVEC